MHVSHHDSIPFIKYKTYLCIGTCIYTYVLLRLLICRYLKMSIEFCVGWLEGHARLPHHIRELELAWRRAQVTPTAPSSPR